MKCYASDYCQKDKSSCSDVCGGYRVLRALTPLIVTLLAVISRIM